MQAQEVILMRFATFDKQVFLRIVVLVLIAGCATPGDKRPDFAQWSNLPQLRAFLEAELRPSGEPIIVARIYAMKVLEDGSEKVLWRRTMETNLVHPGLIIYRFGYLNKETVCIVDFLGFLGSSGCNVYVFDLNTGECFNAWFIETENPSEKELSKAVEAYGEVYSWHGLPTLERMIRAENHESKGYQRVVFPPRVVAERFPDTGWRLTIPEGMEIITDSDIQIRRFLDKGVVLQDGTTGVQERIFGMKVLHDGSERVVWKWAFDELGIKGVTGILPPDSKTLYLKTGGVKITYPDGSSKVYKEEVLKLDRRTGQLLARFENKVSAGTEYEKLQKVLEKYRWSDLPVFVRPFPLPKSASDTTASPGTK
jgi:hypothetical protein